ISDLDVVVLPGGFSYGDYLRCGAIARFSPVMKATVEHAKQGKLVLGICNGFQVLTEAGLLPGALTRNAGLNFICDRIPLKVERTNTLWTSAYKSGQIINLPIAHGEGRYYADADTLAQLEDGGQILFRYCTETGEISDTGNPNGSLNNIAGICNRQGNVLGMMPHPERASDPMLGNTDGRKLFEGLLVAIAGAVR
ncbi:MAG TPA: phosphoribosylformylglycinamidine synthase subunit PurQ, partial [Kamptonema sp.]|nr:phosphoribosylformylglycinamidine synthase subunit PurQ [Kamptonema sp.]